MADQKDMSQARGRTRLKAIEKRQRILDATAKILVATGSADFPLQDVAQEVGIYTASIYYYFDSREELINEVLLSSISQYYTQLSQFVDALPPDVTPIERIREALKATVLINASLDDYRRAYTLVIGRPSDLLEQAIRERRQDIRRLWAGLLDDAKAAGEIDPDVDITLLRYVMVGATQWVSFWYRPEGPLASDYIAETYADLLLRTCIAPGKTLAPPRRAAPAPKAAPKPLKKAVAKAKPRLRKAGS